MIVCKSNLRGYHRLEGVIRIEAESYGPLAALSSKWPSGAVFISIRIAGLFDKTQDWLLESRHESIMSLAITKAAIRPGAMRWLRRSVIAFCFVCALLSSADAQQRPLLTEDVDIIKPGVIRIETGVEFLQNQQFPLSGLRGDLTRLGDSRLSFGLSSNVEFQIEWTVRTFFPSTDAALPRFR